MRYKMKETIQKKLETLKIWLSEKKLTPYLKISIFSLITFFWSYLITGSIYAALIYLISSASISLIKILIYKKKIKEIQIKKQKIINSLVFILIKAATFIISIFIIDSLLALITLITWFIIFMSYQKADSIRQWTVGAIIPFAIIMFAEFMKI